MARPSPFAPPTAAQQAAADALAPRLLGTAPGLSGGPSLRLLAAESAEFKALGVPPLPPLAGLEPSEGALAAAIGLLAPGRIAEAFGGVDGAVSAGQALGRGAALLYGLQASAVRHGDAEAARALIRGEAGMGFVFIYLAPLAAVAGAEWLDAFLLARTAAWQPRRELLVWQLLELHEPWSEPLSRRMVECVAAEGSTVSAGWISWHGNAFADRLHADCIARAIEVLRPLAPTQRDAKRWLTRLRKRVPKAPPG